MNQLIFILFYHFIICFICLTTTHSGPVLNNTKINKRRKKNLENGRFRFKSLMTEMHSFSEKREQPAFKNTSSRKAKRKKEKLSVT